MKIENKIKKISGKKTMKKMSGLFLIYFFNFRFFSFLTAILLSAFVSYKDISYGVYILWISFAVVAFFYVVQANYVQKDHPQVNERFSVINFLIWSAWLQSVYFLMGNNQYFSFDMNWTLVLAILTLTYLIDFQQRHAFMHVIFFLFLCACLLPLSHISSISMEDIPPKAIAFLMTCFNSDIESVSLNKWKRARKMIIEEESDRFDLGKWFHTYSLKMTKEDITQLEIFVVRTSWPLFCPLFTFFLISFQIVYSMFMIKLRNQITKKVSFLPTKVQSQPPQTLRTRTKKRNTKKKNTKTQQDFFQSDPVVSLWDVVDSVYSEELF